VQVVVDMKKALMALACSVMLMGCASFSVGDNVLTGSQFEQPKIEKTTLTEPQFVLPKPANGPMVVAVYNFLDRTGQRKPSPMIAQLSSAVTQGAETYLIKALQDVGGGSWFKVVERVGLDNLMKERQMIRQMREIYEGENARPLPPMLFAGIMIEGGIVGYDSNIVTGGTGVRVFGIGPQTQYQADMITVSLRVVNVSTGEILVSVITTKTVYSYMDKLGVLKFFEEGTLAVEAETGMGINESSNRATSMAIQAAVVEMIREGERKGFWEYDLDSLNQIKEDEQIKLERRESKKMINRINRTVSTLTQINQNNQKMGEINEQDQ
jgi:curli production assembly/transport component CsgG